MQGVAVLRLLQQQALHTHTTPATSFTSCTFDSMPSFTLISADPIMHTEHKIIHLGCGCLYLILGEELGPQWPPQCPQLEPPALLVHLHTPTRPGASDCGPRVLSTSERERALAMLVHISTVYAPAPPLPASTALGQTTARHMHAHVTLWPPFKTPAPRAHVAMCMIAIL